jgi:hypothetical protein
MLGKNPSCGFCGSMMSNSAHCRIINCPRVEAIGTFLKGTNQFVERHFCLRRRVSGRWLEASKYTHESPRMRSLYPSIATSLLAKVSHMSFYTKLITEQQK